MPGSSAGLQQQIMQAAAYLQAHGLSYADAQRGAYARVYDQLQAHAHFLAFMDCFYVIGILTLVAAPLVLLTKPFKVGGGGGAAH